MTDWNSPQVDAGKVAGLSAAMRPITAMTSTASPATPPSPPAPPEGAEGGADASLSASLPRLRPFPEGEPRGCTGVVGGLEVAANLAMCRATSSNSSAGEG